MFYQVSWDFSSEVVSINRIEYGYHSLFDYLIFRFLTISMIIQYKPQTTTGGITPRLAKCPILKRQTVFPNSHSQFQFASIINNNQMNDATIIILCKIVVLRIISKNFILPPFSISILLLGQLINEIQ